MAKILLVEDDNNLREIYEARLQAEGYTIVSAMDGEEALVVAKQEKPDLIISDVMMPRISGFEMLDILRNTDGLKEVKIIMLTALGQAEDRTRADSLGADRYLVKSQVTLEDIVKAAQELLIESGATPAPVAPPAADTTTAPTTPTPAQPPTPVQATTPPAAAPAPVAPAAPAAPAPATPAVTPAKSSDTPTPAAPVTTTPRAAATPTISSPSPATQTPVQPEPTAPTPAAAAAPASVAAPSENKPEVRAPAADTTTAPTTPTPAQPPTPVQATTPPAAAPAPAATAEEPEPATVPAPATSDPEPTGVPAPTEGSTPSGTGPQAQTTSDEQATVKAQIEQFVNQVEPATPGTPLQSGNHEGIPAQSASDTPTSPIQPPSTTESESPIITSAAPPSPAAPAQTTTPAPAAPASAPPATVSAPAPTVVSPSDTQTAITTQNPGEAFMSNAIQGLVSGAAAEPQAQAAPPQPPAPGLASEEAINDDSAPVAHKKIIKPLSHPEERTPNLDELLAKEGFTGFDDDDPHPSAPMPAAPQPAVATPPAAAPAPAAPNTPQLPTTPHPPGHVISPTGGSVDPNSIAL